MWSSSTTMWTTKNPVFEVGAERGSARLSFVGRILIANERVKENLACPLERYAMLCDICGRLLLVPAKPDTVQCIFHVHSATILSVFIMSIHQSFLPESAA